MISGGGTITAGAGTNAINVTWHTVGNQTISVNYTNPSGCSSSIPTVKNVVVNPLPVPSLSGASSVCKGTSGEIYSTETGMANYQWTISPGGVITSGVNTNMVSVNWTAAGQQSLSVNYRNSMGCQASNPVIKIVTVKPLPTPSIVGIDSICLNQTVT